MSFKPAVLAALLLTTTIGVAEQRVIVTKTTVVRTGNGDSRRDRPELDMNRTLHPVVLFHRGLTKPIKQLLRGVKK